jgi:hypothetical protein
MSNDKLEQIRHSHSFLYLYLINSFSNEIKTCYYSVLFLRHGLFHR